MARLWRHGCDSTVRFTATKNRPDLRYTGGRQNAGVAQLVERNLAKVEVESSRLFSRSIFNKKGSAKLPFFHSNGAIANRLCNGLQIRLAQFDSGSRLQKSCCCNDFME